MNVYYALAVEEDLTYGKLKEGLLKRFQCYEDAFQEKFRSARPNNGESLQAFSARLQLYFSRWTEMAEMSTETQQI